ncbi:MULTISPECIES: GlsB/YeaQ/YmgE family stress response membrane protein [unclassified Erwinia]|uniref:GlsB/YeaQ/YmgE family stress response membrane protein n=1 Tax=unclassified Erwinia TaxID=2622719 RepID=UPI00082B9CE3|nr:GlsB/YeaQ/YmgE family stress response membrane protein [Erwinia sp. ErVv1]
MGLLCWIIIGLLTGLASRIVLHGRPGGRVPALVLTVVGALIGGYISAFLNDAMLAELSPEGLLAALAGALVMLLVVRKLRI